VRKTDNLPHSSTDVIESGSLNLPEPSGPHRPVMVILNYLCLFYCCKGCALDVCSKLHHSYLKRKKNLYLYFPHLLLVLPLSVPTSNESRSFFLLNAMKEIFVTVYINRGLCEIEKLYIVRCGGLLKRKIGVSEGGLRSHAFRCW
jgi:hypothetical protein